MSGRRVLFYPERPAERAVIAPICRASGSTIVTDPRAPCDLAIAWDTNTFRDRMPALERLQNSVAVWTLRCVDIGKPRVDSAFREALAGR